MTIDERKNINTGVIQNLILEIKISEYNYL